MAFLGYTLTKNGVKPGSDKASAVKNAAPPTTVKQIRAFVVFGNFL